MEESRLGCSPFDRCSTELLDIIFRHVHIFDGSNLHNATIVCKAWHYVAQLIIDEKLDIIIGSATPNLFYRTLDRLRTHKPFRSRVRHLYVQEWYGSGFLPERRAPATSLPWVSTYPEDAALDGFMYKPGQDASWAQIEALAAVTGMLNLCRFIWAAQPRLPKILMGAVSTIPNCRLEIIPRGSTLSGLLLPGFHTSNSLAQLQPHSSLLHRLGIMIESLDKAGLEQLGQVLGLSRRLKSLSIQVIGQVDAPEYSFTPLTSVRWLNAKIDALPRLSKLELSNVCACHQSVWKEWFGLIQWSHLEEAHFSCASFVLNGSSALSHLKSLSLCLDSPRQPWWQYCPQTHDADAITSVLYKFERLQRLRLRNATEAIDADVLTHLGKTLEILDTRDLSAAYFSADLLSQMGDSCPFLSDLMIAAPSSGEKLREILDTLIKSLKFVRYLHLHFDHAPYGNISATPGFMNGERWTISNETCHELWHYLSNYEGSLQCSIDSKHHRPRHCKIPLKTLTISVGSIEDGFHPILTTTRRAANGKSWIITPGTSPEPCVDIRCPEMDVVQKHMEADAEHAWYYQGELKSLRNFAQPVVQQQYPVQDVHVLMMPPGMIAKKQLIMARLRENGLTEDGVTQSQPISRRVPL